MAHAQSARDIVLERYRQYLHRTEQVSGTDVGHWMHTLRADGTWPDIHYGDLQRANWDLLHHLDRVQNFCLAWTDPHSPFYKDTTLWSAIRLSLGNWLTHKYQNPNWWHNQIGVPQLMRDILVLVMDRLSAPERKEALAVLGQLRVQRPGAGANLTWSADLGLHEGLLTGDTALIDSCRRLIVGEIRISKGEGVQPDYSFHQHGPRLQMYQYGKAFLWSNLRIAWELRGTPWAFPAVKVDLLSGFLVKGWQWMARGVNTVPGTMDRSASRVGELRSPDMRFLIPFAIELDPARRKAFNAVLKEQRGRYNLSGFRYFPYSDFTAYQQKDFSFFLKTISSRTYPAEVGLNQENLDGKLMNSGNAYLLHSGDEYYNLMPVWDWSRLPGITAFPGASSVARKPFVGSVGDGRTGFSVMDYQMNAKTPGRWITAHKYWACDGDQVVCLVAGLTAHGLTDTLYTVLDQSRLSGPVSANGRILEPGLYRMDSAAWIYHAGFAYIPLGVSPILIRLGERTGTWSRINRSETDSLVTDQVFAASLLDGNPSASASFGYVLAYTGSAGKAASLARRQPWKILRNDTTCQAVLWPDGRLMAAFFSAGTLQVKGTSLKTDRPCLLFISGKKIYASNPSHQDGQWRITWGKQSQVLKLPADGTTSEIFTQSK